MNPYKLNEKPEVGDGGTLVAGVTLGAGWDPKSLVKHYLLGEALEVG